MTDTAATRAATQRPATDHAAVWQAYTDVWQAGSDRRAVFEATLAPECIYTDPLVQARGYDELDAYVRDFQRQVPGGRFVTEQFAVHHDLGLVHWTMRDGAGQRLSGGTSFAEFAEDGRLQRMTGFFDVPEN